MANSTDERERVILTVAKPDWSGPVLFSKRQQPLFRSELSDGVNIVCGGCKEFPVGENILPQQFHGIGLECPSCRTVNSTPALPRGEPLPISRTTVVAEPRVEVGHPLRVDRFTAYVDLAGAEQVVRETGVRVSWSVIRSKTMGRSIDPFSFLTAANIPPSYPIEVRQTAEVGSILDRALRNSPDALRILGEEVLREPESAERVSDHSFVRALRRLRRSIRPSSSLPPETLRDLSLVLHTSFLFYRWRYHPRYPKLIRRLGDAKDFLHDTAVVAIATKLADLGNGVGLLREVKERKTADIEVVAGPVDRLVVEVKTRQELAPDRESLAAEAAERAVRGAIDDAGIGSGGQLDPSQPGVLALGGYRLTRQEFDLTLSAAQRQMADWPDSTTHIAAILVCSIGGVDLSPRSPEANIDVPELVTGFVPNLNFRADIQLRPYVLSPTLVLPSRDMSITG